ncbi:c-type cytochrome [Endothiovibrio diazotrophicus]
MSNYSTHFGTSMAAAAAVVALNLFINSAVTGALRGAPMEDGMTLSQRITPVANVYTTNDKLPEVAAAPAPAPAPAAAAAPAGAARGGEEVYNSVCHVCHATGAAGAPKMGDTAAWAPRIEKGIDALMHSALNGLNAMPPRGTCGNCSDDELKGAIEYMVSKSQ